MKKKKRRKRRGWWTKEKVLEMNELRLAEDLTLEEIGGRYGISHVWVSNLLKKFEISIIDKNESEKIKLLRLVKRKDIRKETVVDLYIDQGLKVEDVVTNLNITERDFYKLLKFYGIPKRQPTNYKRSEPLTYELLYRMFIEERLTARQIARELDYSSTSIAHTLSKLGIKANQRSPKATAR